MVIASRPVRRQGLIDFPQAALDIIKVKVGELVDIDKLDDLTLTVRKHGIIPPPIPPNNTIPSQVTGLVATAPNPNEVDLKWNKNPETDISTYNILRDAIQLGFVSEVNTITYQDKTVTPGKEYAYAVQAVNSGGNKGPQSSAVKVTTPVTPPPVSNLYDDFNTPSPNAQDPTYFDFRQNQVKSPNGKWLAEYGIHVIDDPTKGYIKIENGMLHFRPWQENAVTHSVLVRSTQQFINAKFSFDMKLGARNWTSPETWHSVWFFFRHQNHYRHMYGVLKTNGFEFGKKDVPDGTPQPEVELNQRFTYQNNNFRVIPGFMHHCEIEVTGGMIPTIKITLDGKFVGQYTDDGTLQDGKGPIPKPTYQQGEFCLYTEDAEGFFDNIYIEPRP